MGNCFERENSASTSDYDSQIDAKAICKHKGKNELKKEMFYNFEYDEVFKNAHIISKIYKYKVEIHPQAFAKNFNDANTILQSIYKDIRKEYGVTLFYLHEEMYARKRVRFFSKFWTMHKEREVTVIIKDGSLAIAENVNNLVFYNLFFRQIARNQRLRFINTFLFRPKSAKSSKESSIWLFYKLTKNMRHHQPGWLLTLDIPDKLASIKSVYDLIPHNKNNYEGEDEEVEIKAKKMVSKKKSKNRMEPEKFEERANKKGQVDKDENEISGTVVVTRYNYKNTYIISEIWYDMDPTSRFDWYDKKTGSVKSVTYVNYLKDTYNITVEKAEQPMIKAYIQNKNESIYLVPELCYIVGKRNPIDVKDLQTYLSNWMNLMQVDKMKRSYKIFECLQNGKNKEAVENSSNWVTRQGSLTTDDDTNSEVDYKSDQNNGYKKYKPFPPNIGLLDTNKSKLINCKFDTAKIKDWAILYLESDEELAGNFIRKLTDIAVNEYEFTKPRVFRAEKEKDMANFKKLADEFNMIVIIVPKKNNRKIYNDLKRCAMTECHIPTQFINIDKIEAMLESEKRKESLENSEEAESIFSLEQYWRRVFKQMYIKVGGTLWEIENTYSTGEKILIIGISFLKKRNESGKSILCTTFSVNDKLNQYFAVWKQQDKTNFRKVLEDWIGEGLEKFKNKLGTNPTKIVVYREEVSIFQQANLLQSEISIIRDKIKDFCKREQEPKFCFIVTTTSRVSMYFTEKDLNIPNAQLGSYVSETEFKAPIPKWDDFLLVSRMSNKKIPVFTHYLIMHNELEGYSKEDLIQLTYKLWSLYFHSNQSIEIPAPLKYAQTLKDLIGNINYSEADGYKLPEEILDKKPSLCFI